MSSRPTCPLPAPVLRFLRSEAAGASALLAATGLALVWANSPWAPLYLHLWHAPIPLFLVNDGLMTAFFLQVGLTIRRELHEGALADLRVAGLPLLAALGGVTAPALIYLLCAPEAPRGWAVPTATDIAFAVGILSLVGPGTPPALRLLLLTLAIADDLAATLIIAFGYPGRLEPAGLLLAAAGLVGHAALQRTGRGGWIGGILAGAVMWRGLLLAGVQPALTGVILGLGTQVQAAPAARRPGLSGGAPDGARLEAALHPWVAFLVMPLFALVNAGVDVRGLALQGGLALHVAAGITAGLVLGKPLGIILACRLAMRAGLVTLPPEVRPRHLLLLGSLSGIGFTMSMFLCNLAFADTVLLSTARVSVLGASALAAALALLAGRRLRAAPGGPPANNGI